MDENNKRAEEVTSRPLPNELSGEIVKHFIGKEVFSKENLGIGTQNLEQLYRKAKNLYEVGKYKDAQLLFTTLRVLDPNCAPFVFGLASTSFMLKEDDGAIESFLAYSQLNPSDPMPFHYLSICYERKNDIPSTLQALQLVVDRAGSQSDYQSVKHRAQMTLENLKTKYSTPAQENGENQSEKP